MQIECCSITHSETRRFYRNIMHAPKDKDKYSSHSQRQAARYRKQAAERHVGAILVKDHLHVPGSTIGSRRDLVREILSKGEL